MNIKKILIYNLVGLIIVFLTIELLCYVSLCCKYNEDIKNFINITTGKKINIPYLSYKKVYEPNIQDSLNKLRPIENRNSKQPIFLFGCSYTYGFGLGENQTFSKKLADYTNKTVYNRGLSGTGIPFLYNQLSNEKIINTLPNNPEYIIFTLIPDHFPRLFRYRNWVMSGDHTLRYKLTSNNELVLDKSSFLPIHSLFTSIVIEEFIVEKKSNDFDKMTMLANKLFLESNNIIKSKFKDAKFVILYYRSKLDSIEVSNMYIENLKEVLKDANIIFIDLYTELPQLSDDKYWLEDNSHPSEQAWDLIVPYLSKKLNLK